ncbi:MAG: metallopeptidase family protein [Oscillospiraceae bacterium]|nr:metallopeptidase family protein [Oscillospiraceae bacterium]
MFSIDDINEMLDEIAAELPEEVFRELNGGVSLLPDLRRSNADPGGGLYTLGEYRRDQMGRYIVIYYGSIQRVHGGASREEMRAHLKDVLHHELTHHIESLAGERDLEIEDEEFLEEYFQNKKQ